MKTLEETYISIYSNNNNTLLRKFFADKLLCTLFTLYLADTDSEKVLARFPRERELIRRDLLGLGIRLEDH